MIEIVSFKNEELTFNSTLTTSFWKYVDDIQIRVVTESNSIVVYGDSKSRVGKSDYGQNMRNLNLLTSYTKLRETYSNNINEDIIYGCNKKF